MKRREKTTSQLRQANRGNVPGMLGLEELAKLAGKSAEHLKPAKLPKETKR